MADSRAVVFDIGNVLIAWRPEAFYDRVIGPERRRALWEAVPIEAMNLEIDGGADIATRVEAEAAAFPDWSDEIRLWHSRWLEMLGPAIDRSVRLLRALRRAGVPTYALTNFGARTFEIATENYPFLEEFDKAIVSAHLQVTKPDPRIYAAVEEVSGLPPDRLFFTDDRLENIEAAAARGWRTHLFEGPEGLAERLVAEGLLTEKAAA